MKNIRKNKFIYKFEESIRDFKRSGDLLKWIHSNGTMNVSLLTMYSIAYFNIDAFYSPLTSFDPNKGVFTIIESVAWGKNVALISQGPVYLLNLSGPIISTSPRNSDPLNNRVLYISAVRKRCKLVGFHIWTEKGNIKAKTCIFRF